MGRSLSDMVNAVQKKGAAYATPGVEQCVCVARSDLAGRTQRTVVKVVSADETVCLSWLRRLLMLHLVQLVRSSVEPTSPTGIGQPLEQCIGDRGLKKLLGNY